ncbi:hypothetical protein ACP275_06G023600 [Erythranthe tilingii]
MNYQSYKLVSFQDSKSGKKIYEQTPSKGGLRLAKLKSTLSSVSNKFQRGLEYGSERIKRFTGSIRSFSSGKFLTDDEGSRNKILDPQGSYLQKWNKIFVLSCVIAVSLDPLFLYIPIINNDKKCLDSDKNLEIAASVLRSFTDIFYVVHIIFQFRTGFIAPPSRVFGRGVIVQDSWEIAKRYLSSYFIIDILAVLPLPQIVILIIIPKLKGARSLNTKNLLKLVVIFQYVPRVLRVYPLYREVTITSGILTETAWAGAAFNLFLYMLASHVLGAFWYLFSIERETTCWEKACGNGSACREASFYCGADHTGFSQILNEFCPVRNANATLMTLGYSSKPFNLVLLNQKIFLRSSFIVSGGDCRI